jgi:hypothetical protein
MARPRPALPVKLFMGLLSGDPDLLRRARQLLSRRWGAIDLESDVWTFDQTDYYCAEMGPNLQRWFLGFEQLVAPDHLAEIKLETNALEQQLADDCLLPEIARPVNIDPGYVDLTKLVLATTKDRGHRIYLGRGIYAEVTLQYTRSAWQTLPWTYPDYTRPDYHAFFTRLRERYREQHHALGRPVDDGAPANP